MKRVSIKLMCAVVTFLIGVGVTSFPVVHHANKAPNPKFELVRTLPSGRNASWIYSATDGTEVIYSQINQSFQSSRSAIMNACLDDLKRSGGNIIETKFIKNASGDDFDQRIVSEMQRPNRTVTRILWSDEHGFYTIDCDSREVALAFEDAVHNGTVRVF